jgi:predicted transcriptional regulator
MTSDFVPSAMSPEERAQHGAALAKGVAFDAVYALYRRRQAEGWTNARIASNVGVDEGWLSKQFVGPRNATMKSVGTLVEGMDGVLEIKVHALEDLHAGRINYDAYAEYEAPLEQKPISQVPPIKEGGLMGDLNDPSLNNILELIRKPDRAPVPVVS